VKSKLKVTFYAVLIICFRQMTHGIFAIGTIHSTGLRSSMHNKKKKTGLRSHSYVVAIADFDNDKMSDIVVANSGTNNVLILYRFGNGTFGNEESSPK